MEFSLANFILAASTSVPVTLLLAFFVIGAGAVIFGIFCLIFPKLEGVGERSRTKRRRT